MDRKVGSDRKTRAAMKDNEESEGTSIKLNCIEIDEGDWSNYLIAVHFLKIN